MNNEVIAKAYQASVLLAAIRMTAAATHDDERDSEQLIAQRVGHIMHRMNNIRQALVDVIAPGKIAGLDGALFNYVTDIALQQACFEQTQEKNPMHYLLGAETIKALLKDAEEVDGGNLDSSYSPIPIRLAYIGLCTQILQDFSRLLHIPACPDSEYTYSAIMSHVKDIIAEALHDFPPVDDPDVENMSPVLRESITVYGQIYSNSLHEVISQQEQMPENYLEAKSDVEDLDGIGPPVDDFDDEKDCTPPDLFLEGITEEDDEENVLFSGMTASDIFESVWETFQLRKQQMLGNINKLNQAIQEQGTKA